MIHFDTSFVVDLMREASAGKLGPARALLASFRQDEVAISLFVACELAAGVALAARADEERAKVQRACAKLRVVYPDEGFPESFGGILRALRRSGRNVGTMDVSIATAAIQERARLVTRDRKDFLDVPDLRLIAY
ncbi:MAG TPA: type II toxin-antitoxin system VapC family toxin [Thermoanaerobaculia bacterium]|nr:type II toxin-antitoxin system VapC family toxin [Thermoanaerobaculia bacterium]